MSREPDAVEQSIQIEPTRRIGSQGEAAVKISYRMKCSRRVQGDFILIGPS
jgi:hypothetical protein